MLTVKPALSSDELCRSGSLTGCALFKLPNQLTWEMIEDIPAMFANVTHEGVHLQRLIVAHLSPQIIK